MARLLIEWLYPSDRTAGRRAPPQVVPSVKRCPSDGDALDEANKLLQSENERQHKDAKKLPALNDLRIECDDGSIMDYATVRRLAPQIRD
jgi:hypothetical protein